MKIKCIKGTRDYLPQEAELREKIQQTILDILADSELLYTKLNQMRQKILHTPVKGRL